MLLEVKVVRLTRMGMRVRRDSMDRKDSMGLSLGKDLGVGWPKRGTVITRGTDWMIVRDLLF